MPSRRRLSGGEARRAGGARGGWSSAVFLAVLLGLTALRLVIAARVPLTPDEAYYWCWSRHLQAGYLDHPGMVAVWIRIGTFLWGDSPLGVRWLGPISTCLGSIFIWRAARGLTPHARGGIRAAALLNATLMIGVGALTMTPDTPLVFFCTVALWAALRVVRGGGWGWGAVTGVALGAAFDSKYSAALLIAAFFVWGVAGRWDRRRFQWMVAAGLSGLLTVMPVLIWNAAHGWASFAKQGGRAGVWHPGRALQFLGELLGGQVLLATPAIFVIFALTTSRLIARSRTDAVARLLGLSVVVPALVFLVHAIGDRVQANWPVLVYPAAALGAAHVVQRVKGAIVTGAVLCAAVYLQLLTGIIPLPPKLDVVGRQTGGWAELAQALRPIAGGTVYAEDYAVAAELAYVGRGLHVAGLEDRWSLSGLPRGPMRRGILVIGAGRSPSAPFASFVSGGVVTTVCRQPGRCFDVYRVTPATDATQHATYLPTRR